MKNIIRMSLVAGAMVTSVAAQAQTAWTDKVTLGGDLRARYNRIFDEQTTPTGSQIANSTQIRARLTAAAKVNEAMSANFRLATHNNNLSNRSSNDTLGDTTAGGKSTFDLELAYGDWRVMQGLVVSVGKAPNPFWSPGKNEMIWDADLAFDGVTAKWAADMDMLKPFVNMTYNTIAQRESSNIDSSVNIMQQGIQAGATMGFGDMMRGTLAVGYHSFNNATEGTGAFQPAGVDLYLINVGAELGLDMVANLPISVYGDWVQNNGTKQNEENNAWLAGVNVGQFNNVGSWQAWYNFRDVGGQAVNAGIADSEFAGGAGVNVNGHQLGGGYMAWENTTVGLNYWNNHYAGGGNQGNDYERWTADLVWKF